MTDPESPDGAAPGVQGGESPGSPAIPDVSGAPKILAPPVPILTPPIADATPSNPAVGSTRRLLGASFDLLGRASDDMRRASFYIGGLVLMTIGPVAMSAWALEVATVHHTEAQLDRLARTGPYAWFGSLVYVALAGLVVAAVESRVMAAALLGGRLAGRPITVRQALARSRMSFWRAVVGSILLAVPVGLAQGVLGAIAIAVLGPQTDVSVIIIALIAAVIGAPLAYILTGVVLGDVDPFEAARRSVRVFRARKVAAVLVAIFESVAVVLVLLGLSAGLDLVLRLFDALGVGVESGPAGLAFVSIGLLVVVFAFGTLVYTAIAISITPQVVMFVGLTEATIGLDHVRPGGDHDPAVRRPGERRFRWFTRPVLLASAYGVVGMAVFVGSLLDTGA